MPTPFAINAATGAAQPAPSEGTDVTCAKPSDRYISLPDDSKSGVVSQPSIDIPSENPDAPYLPPSYQRAADFCGLSVYAQEGAIKIIEKITFTDGTSVSLDGR